MKIIGEKLLNVSLKDGKARIWLENELLSKIGLGPGTRYVAKPDRNDQIVIEPSEIGNVVSSRKRGGKTIPIIDKAGGTIREALKNCSTIVVKFCLDENSGDGRIIIKGIKKTADVLKDNQVKDQPLRSISFCAGAGISSDSLNQAGFEEVAAVEWNPPSKEGSDDKFASIYQENHEAVMFNIPMQSLDAEDLPLADLWCATLDCTDFSKLAAGKTEYCTMHLFIHLMRLFYQLPKDKRPKAILIENTENFSKVPAQSLKLCLEEEGYYVEMGMLNSLDYGSRTKRERFFFVATIYEGFSFPEPTGRQDTPISSDGVITVDSLDWITPEEHATLRHFVERQRCEMTHNHKITSFDVDSDAYVGVIPKSHYKYIPENIIRHPRDKNKYAFLRKEEHLRYLHGIRPDLYLGDSTKRIIESIGQGVCMHTFNAISKKLYMFLQEKIKLTGSTFQETTTEEVVYHGRYQLTFAFGF